MLFSIENLIVEVSTLLDSLLVTSYWLHTLYWSTFTSINDFLRGEGREKGITTLVTFSCLIGYRILA